MNRFLRTYRTVAKPLKLTLPNGVRYEQPTGIFVNNEFLATDIKIAVINPSTEEKILDIYSGNSVDVDFAVDSAEKAYNEWSKSDPQERSRLLYKLADLMETNSELLAAIESTNNGKTLALARGDVKLSVACFRSAAGYAGKLFGKTIDSGPGYFNYTIREPIGVVGQIIPWNFPLMMSAWKLGPALAAGNTIGALKPASATPLTALFLGQLIKEAGFPKGVVNIIPGPGGAVGDAITNHPKIRKVAFTGSTEVGRDVAIKSTASNLKKVTLELGGKSAHLVFNDCDVKKTLPNLVQGIFLNAGQICSSGSRIYVQEEIYPVVLEAFKDYVEQIKVGSPFDPANFQGALTTKQQFKTVLSYIEKGKAAGAKLLTGGNRVGSKGYFVQPTIFYDVQENMDIVKEEIFGPVVTISKFKTLEEAVEMANSTEYGLGAGIETESLTTAHTVAAQLKAGTVWINTYNDFHHEVPFGGCKQSGYGREMGMEAFESYLQTKAVRVKL